VLRIEARRAVLLVRKLAFDDRPRLFGGGQRGGIGCGMARRRARFI
jgi:hypothetical protein